MALLAIAGGARADELRAVIDRVELEPASITGQRLRVYLSALSIEGQRLDLTGEKSIRLYSGSSEKHVPYALGTFDTTGEDLALVVLVQVSLDFGDALPTITDALDRELLATLGEHAQVAVIAYGENVSSGKLDKAKTARGKLSGLSSDGSAGDPGLLDAIDRALGLLRRAKPGDRGSQGAPEDRPLRKLVIIIGDGRDRAGDRDRITAAGKRAAKDGVRIHAIAYSPADVRRPLLALGELAKQSLGTFRWPGRGRKPGPESWTEAFKQLHDEILKQYVVTFFVNGDDDIAGKKLHVVASLAKAEATSNEVKVPDSATCAGTACDSGYCASERCITPEAHSGRGILGWVLLVGGCAAGAILALGFVGFVMSKRQQRPRMPMPGGVVPMPGVTPMPGVAPVPVQLPVPGLLPNGRPIPALLVVNGPFAGQRFTLRNGFVIGKQPGCDLLIDDGFTSGQHAMIAMDPSGNCRLYDRGSTNGTFVNGVPVRDTELQHAVAIKIGSTELRFLAQ
jgi:hypothetical protein